MAVLCSSFIHLELLDDRKSSVNMSRIRCRINAVTDMLSESLSRTTSSNGSESYSEQYTLYKTTITNTTKFYHVIPVQMYACRRVCLFFSFHHSLQFCPSLFHRGICYIFCRYQRVWGGGIFYDNFSFTKRMIKTIQHKCFQHSVPFFTSWFLSLFTSSCLLFS